MASGKMRRAFMRTRDASGFDPQRSRVVDRAFLEDTDMIYFVRPDVSDSGEKRTPSCIALQKPVDDGPWVSVPWRARLPEAASALEVARSQPSRGWVTLRQRSRGGFCMPSTHPNTSPLPTSTAIREEATS